MTAPSQTPEAAGLEVVRIIACHLPQEHCPETACLPLTITAGDLRAVYAALVTAASAQAAIDAEKAKVAELEARNQAYAKEVAGLYGRANDAERCRDAYRDQGQINEDRATAAEARADRLAQALRKSREGWANALELDLLPPRHEETAADLRDEADAALQQEAKP